MEQAVGIAKALGDAGRLRLLMALRGRELCVCQLLELLRLAPSTVSVHLAVLRRARLVAARKKGRWVYYRLPDRGAPEPVRRALAWAAATLKGEPTIDADARRLETVLACEPRALCRRQVRRQNPGRAGKGR
ncbi:MAG: helix-turn-helix transcriptional regulator [Planctomycetes bacterium]|nr:helix-turn-helix transcriptional regulator [Planctomycetota bacterium]